MLNVNPLELQDLSDTVALSDDGYRYKTVRKLKYRHRRDVNNIPIPFPSDFDFAANYPEEAGVSPSSSDGYKYKTIKRFRIRKRRAAIDLPTGDYLPPAEEETIPAHELADDGYHYKTVRTLKYRRSWSLNGDFSF